MSFSRIIFIFILACLSTKLVFGQVIQITESAAFDPVQVQNWVMNTLHGGGGEFDTASIKFIGDPQQLGKFHMGGPSIEIDSGLVISNGQVMQIRSYNNEAAATHHFGGPSDPDLDQMYLQTYGLDVNPFPPPVVPYTGDAAVLEFIYKPYGDEIVLTYVFGSEEYAFFALPPPPSEIDYTGLSEPYSLDEMFDIFAISIERPGNPFINRAKFADIAGEVDVAVNTINHETNYNFYTVNPVFSSSLGVQFDGFTKPKFAMQIRREVTPCVTHKIKIAIEDFAVAGGEGGGPADVRYSYNSGVFLEGGSLVGGEDTPPWTVDYKYTNTRPVFDGKLIEGGCNDLLVTFKLGFPSTSNDPYYIPFKIQSSIYRDNLLITDEDSGDLISIDSLTFFEGDTMRTIRIAAQNITADITNVKFSYPVDPCEKPVPPWTGGSFSGYVQFELINNEPFTFTTVPKVYSAYCKETIELRIDDITSGGVEPLVYIWPTNPIPPQPTWNYTIEASPDFVNAQVKDFCGNDSTIQIRINNKPIHLEGIAPLSFCKPGMQQDVEVLADLDFHNFPDYGFSNVNWFNLWYTPPFDLGSGNPKTIIYDETIGEDVFFIKYNVTDVCGGTTTDTLKVDQTGKLDLGNDFYICLGESVELTNYTPVFNNDPDNYKWYIKNPPPDSTIIGTGNTITVTPSDTTTYYLYIYDKCEQAQIDSLVVYVDHFLPQIIVSPSSAEVCPGEPVTLTANTANVYSWDPGSYTTQSITLTEYTPNVYSYTLTASSDYCLDKQASASYEVFPQPTADFLFDPAEEACTGEDIHFTYSDDPTGKVFNWNFGDNTTSTIPNPVHFYDVDGLYTVYLHVQQYICDEDTSITVQVNPLPAPDFTIDVNEGCLPVAVQFTDQSQDLYPGASYNWDLGDGTISTDRNPSHIYDQAGIFSVGLEVHNTERCFASVSKPNLIQVNPNPVADFDVDPHISTMDDPTFTFSNFSVSDSSIVYYEWDFGDGNTSGDENPVHVYDHPGDFEIHLRIETVNTCWDTVIGKVAVTQFVKLYIPNAFTPNGDGLNDYFQIKGTPVSDWNLYIYDSWGGQTWSTHNFETQWDGNNYSGQPVPAGSYVYRITGTDYKLDPVFFEGMVTVVR